MNFPDAVTVLRPSGVDQYGNADHSFTAPAEIPARGFLSGESLFLPPGADVLAGDRVRIGDRVYTVDGEPDRLRSPMREVMTRARLKPLRG